MNFLFYFLYDKSISLCAIFFCLTAKCVQKEDVLHAHLKYAQLDKRHQNFLLRVYVFCKDEQIACAKRYTRYRLNYTKLREYRDSVFVGQKSECQYCKANQLMYRQCMQDMAIQCQR